MSPPPTHSSTAHPPTLGDVARAAGVSPATVSRCLNNPDIVRQEIRDNVMAVIDTLGYVPHAAARALASRRSRTIGAIMPSLESSLFGGTVGALQERLTEDGYTLAVAATGFDPAVERDHIRNLIASGVDGLMLVGTLRSQDTYDLIERKNVPYVLTWVREEDTHHPFVGFDNGQAAGNVTRYLLDLGHRQFGLISGLTDGNDRAAARLAGFRRSLAEQGLDPDAASVVEVDFGINQGREAFRRLMKLKPRPTAVVCGADPLAYGAMFEAQAMGLDVPGDVSVTGFDNMELAEHLIPGVTSVQTPQIEMGTLAGDYLLSRLAGKEVTAPPALETALIVRGSTGPAPA